VLRLNFCLFLPFNKVKFDSFGNKKKWNIGRWGNQKKSDPEYLRGDIAADPAEKIIFGYIWFHICHMGSFNYLHEGTIEPFRKDVHQIFPFCSPSPFLDLFVLIIPLLTHTFLFL